MGRGGMTQEVVVLRDLETMAVFINEGQRRIATNLSHAINDAIAVGEVLLEAQTQMDVGGFGRWIDESLDIARNTAMNYMRLAQFQDLLPAQITSPVIVKGDRGIYSSSATIGKAMSYLAAIGATRSQGVFRKVDIDEVRRLKETGASNREIARMLSVSHAAVCWALKSKQERDAYIASRKHERRARDRAVARDKLRTSVKQHGGSVSEAYSLVRRALQQLQASHDNYPASNNRRALAAAITHLHHVEDAIGRAMRETGS